MINFRKLIIFVYLFVGLVIVPMLFSHAWAKSSECLEGYHNGTRFVCTKWKNEEKKANTQEVTTPDGAVKTDKRYKDPNFSLSISGFRFPVERSESHNLPWGGEARLGTRISYLVGEGYISGKFDDKGNDQSGRPVGSKLQFGVSLGAEIPTPLEGFTVDPNLRMEQEDGYKRFAGELGPSYRTNSNGKYGARLGMGYLIDETRPEVNIYGERVDTNSNAAGLVNYIRLSADQNFLDDYLNFQVEAEAGLIMGMERKLDRHPTDENGLMTDNGPVNVNNNTDLYELRQDGEGFMVGGRASFGVNLGEHFRVSLEGVYREGSANYKKIDFNENEIGTERFKVRELKVGPKVQVLF